MLRQGQPTMQAQGKRQKDLLQKDLVQKDLVQKDLLTKSLMRSTSFCRPEEGNLCYFPLQMRTNLKQSLMKMLNKNESI